MAEVENVSQMSPAATAVVATAAISTVADTSVATKGANGKNNDVSQAGNEATSNNELGTSPTQEKSSNSHPHDSEYDTASDLEGGEEYDDEDDMDDSLSDDDDEDDETETDDDEEEDDEGVLGDITLQDKVDAEAQKKVDEDRSNPQYIPKRGTFYEHDDRTVEVEGGGAEGEGSEDPECQIVGNGLVQGTATGSKSALTPTISSASKTMKKWQPASAVDRWSHDRFDPSEQAPKSRSDLVSAYGYDIRTEDAPPKARRRRRYGRGPSKYNRNWEDESAYLKTNNKERKPPKPSDFPALSEKSRKQRRSPTRRIREEKENHMERRQRGEDRPERSERQGQEKNNHYEDYNDRRGEGSHKSTKSKSNFSRQSGQSATGKQVPMEFKQKGRQNNQGPTGFNSQSGGSSLSSRLDAHRQQNTAPHTSQQNNKGPSNTQNYGLGNSQRQIGPSQQQQSDSFNNKKKQDQSYQTPSQPSPLINNTQPQQNSQQQSQSSTSSGHNANRHASAQLQLKTQMPTSNLSQRLQQVQNRNDPSHVGSVQMHALASQNQQQLLQQQQTGNIMMPGPQSTQQAMSQTQEQRGPPKRYSSLRRSQHEAQHLSDHQQMQQMHMPQQQAPAPTQAMLIPAEQAMLQANLMQMYHQENMQAQMQALQVSQQPNVVKPPTYAAAPTPSQPAGAYPGANPPPAAYYVAAPDAYSAATAAQANQAAAASYAAQQAPANYMAQQQTAATLAYANSAPTPQQAAAATSAFSATANVGVVPQASPAQPTPANYQNYNTVGGTTYFVPPHTQPSNRPVSLPQRRPTNAIPILPPSEKSKSQAGAGQQQKSQDTKEDPKSSSGPAIGSAENIDHIIDNMFVQRPVFHPPANNAAGPSNGSKSLGSEQSSSTEISNASNTPSAPNTSSSQDNNTHQSNEKLTNESNTTTTTSSATTIESSNNNPISTQE